MRTERALLCAAAAIALALASAPVAISGQNASIESKVDGVFAKWTETTPGCAVGVASNGKPSLAKGYGMADLEHDARDGDLQARQHRSRDGAERGAGPRMGPAIHQET